MVRRRYRGVRDDRDLPAAEGLDAGDGFALRIGGMDIEVRIVQDFQKLILVNELEDSRVDQVLFGKLQKLFLLRTLSAEDELDLAVEAAMPDGLDDEILPLLSGEPSDHRDDVLVP